MESSKSPAGSVKRHSRNVSYARPRQSTRGPLEEADEYDMFAVTCSKEC